MKDVIKAARTSVSTYKQYGVSGLITLSKDCHKKQPVTPYCTYVDLAGRHIDITMAQAYELPSNDFFGREALLNRLKPTLEFLDIPPEKWGEYLDAVEDTVNKVTDRTLVDSINSDRKKAKQ